jgi:imidazolonepropionase-like amidohydrolase
MTVNIRRISNLCLVPDPSFLHLFCATLALLTLHTTAFSQPAAPDLALTGGTIYINPTDDPIRDGAILIRNGRIAAVGTRKSVKIPRGTQSLDCAGQVIAAGFWNSHIHFFERKWANASDIPATELGRQVQDMITRYGFTSVFDLGSSWENTARIRTRIESGEVPGLRIRTTGEAMVPKDASIPGEAALNILGAMKPSIIEVSNAAEASDAAGKLLKKGVDGLKLFASVPPGAKLPESAIQAAAGEFHRLGKPVFAHPNTAADVVAAIQGGVDVLAHATPRSAWDSTVLAGMKGKRVALIPTLTVWKYLMRHDRLSVQEKITHTEISQLRDWLAAGGTVIFGNDLGAVEYDPTEEYTLMASAGMTFRQILASLTTTPAGRFGNAGHLGQIAPGFDADMVVIMGDPSKDIRALTSVRYTLRAGKIIYRAGE